jgi:hypothetical protein
VTRARRTSLIIDDQLLEKARRLTGLQEETAIVHAGLEVLIARGSAFRLAALCKTEQKLVAPRRRRAKRAHG